MCLSADDLQKICRPPIPVQQKKMLCLLKLVVLITSRHLDCELMNIIMSHTLMIRIMRDTWAGWYDGSPGRSRSCLIHPSMIHRLLLVSLRKQQETQDRQVSIRKYSEIPSWWETNSEYYDDACKLRSITEGIYLSIYTSRMETTEHHHWSYVRSITQQ